MAISYSRVSKPKAGSISSDAQKTFIKKHVAGSRKRITISFSDKGSIGKGRILPGREKAVYEAKKRKTWIVVFSVCRLTRNRQQASKLWDDLKGRIISCSEEISNKKDFLMLASRAQRETSTISRRTKIALDELKRKKRKTGGDIPYGYNVFKNNRLTKNKDEQKVIKKIMQMRKRGMALRKIAKHLDEMGVPSRRDNKWNCQTINQIIKRTQK